MRCCSTARSAFVTVNDSASLDLTTGMTLEAWVYPTVGGNVWRDVIYKGPNDVYYLEGSSDSGAPATGGIFSSPLYGTSALPLNVWSHLAATFDGSNLRLYVNAVQVSSTVVFAQITTSNGALTIGGDASYGQHFAGRIDEVRIHNTARSPSEIQADMNTPVGAPGPPDTQAPTAPPGSRRRLSLRLRSTWPGRRRPTTSAVTGYRVERCLGAGLLELRRRWRPRPGRLTATRAWWRRRVTAIGCGPRMRSANLSGYSSVAERDHAAAAGYAAADGAVRVVGDACLRVADQFGLDGVDRQRRGDRLSGRALPGCGLFEFRPGRDSDRRLLQRHRVGGGDDVQVPGARRRCGPQSERLLEHPERDHPGRARHTATDGADRPDGDACLCDPDQFGLDGVDRQRRRDRLPGRALPGCGLFELRPGGDPDRDLFNDTGLAPATTYRYRVHAADAVPNLSGYSSIQNATTQAGPDTQPPTVPTGLTATGFSLSQVNLSWTASTDNVGVTGYRVERCQGAACSNFVQVGTPTGTSFNNTGLAPATTYRYRVRAADAVPNLSGYSTVESATTFQESTVFTGLTNPSAIEFAADGRVFVAEKGGRIKVFDSLTDSSPDLFGDLSANVHNYWDRGMLGFALDPAFTTGRPYVYVLYTFDAPIGGSPPTFGDACRRPAQPAMAASSVRASRGSPPRATS